MIADELPQPVARLATVVSIAARVEPELLRAARLRLLPDVDVSAEADLWFSELVVRSAKRVVFLPEAANALREKLAADGALLHAARAVVAEVHAAAPAVVQLEEEVTYLALSGGDVTETINSKLLTVLNTIATEKRAGLVDWVARALPRMPKKARETAAAAALELICGSGEIPLVRVQRSIMNNPTLAALLVRALPTTRIHARLIPIEEEELAIEMSRQEMPDAHVIELAETIPIFVEITTDEQTEIVELPEAGSVVRAIVREVTLRTIGGDQYRLIEDRPEARVLASGALSEGDIITGQVIEVTQQDVRVDIGYRVEGLLPLAEAPVTVSRGDTIEVMIKTLNDRSGFVLLDSAAKARVWNEIEEAHKADLPKTGRVLDRVKGGMRVDLGGVNAFLPGSLIDTKPVKNLDTLLGKEFSFKIVSFDKKRLNVIVSRKAIVEVEQAAKKAEVLSRIREGELIHGTVKNITDYGVFVDLGGIDGLLHITDISWGRVTHPSEFFNVGDEVDLIVIKFDAAAERVSLSYKQKLPDPWLDVVERYPIGSRARGKVVSLTDYGAFVELEDGVEGLIHVSEMSWTKKVRHPSSILLVGSEIEAVVADVSAPQRRISLSMKALQSNPWDTIRERYPVGAVIEGRVRNLTDFGAFVEVEEGIDGLIHISDMSVNRRLQHPSEVLKKGDLVTARVINSDPQNQRLSLSIREFLPDEFEAFAVAYTPGDELTGIVMKVTDFGVFVRIGDTFQGLLHVSEVQRQPGEKLDKLFRPGDAVRVRIIKLDASQRRIGLTTRDVAPLTEEERRQLSETAPETLKPTDDSSAS